MPAWCYVIFIWFFFTALFYGLLPLFSYWVLLSWLLITILVLCPLLFFTWGYCWALGLRGWLFFMLGCLEVMLLYASLGFLLVLSNSVFCLVFYLCLMLICWFFLIFFSFRRVAVQEPALFLFRLNIICIAIVFYILYYRFISPYVAVLLCFLSACLWVGLGSFALLHIKALLGWVSPYSAILPLLARGFLLVCLFFWFTGWGFVSLHWFKGLFGRNRRFKSFWQLPCWVKLIIFLLVSITGFFVTSAWLGAFGLSCWPFI